MTSAITARQAKRVMVIIAHPDDGEFTSGGTIARWASEGSEIYYVVCTDGSKGSGDSGLTTEALVHRRQVEQQKAAELLGVREVTFLGRTDGELALDLMLRKEFVRLIRAVKLDTLLTWDPWRHYQLHTDHRAAGQAALDAVMAAENPRHFPEQLGEGLEPHRVEEVYLFGTDAPDIWIDITETFQRKMQAISQHTSQVTNTIAEIEKEVGDWNRHLGENRGFTYAEAFKVLRPHCEICR
ncbi:MAG: hypothetical protein A2144_03105 [Chloroflexi bacterium RBG_16_50_9]|nr:MAG: hypothetical protein A2144_03105 [Chloroflexi bacterium RBG_16_50_9]